MIDSNKTKQELIELLRNQYELETGLPFDADGKLYTSWCEETILTAFDMNQKLLNK